MLFIGSDTKGEGQSAAVCFHLADWDCVLGDLSEGGNKLIQHFKSNITFGTETSSSSCYMLIQWDLKEELGCLY